MPLLPVRVVESVPAASSGAVEILVRGGRVVRISGDRGRNRMTLLLPPGVCNFLAGQPADLRESFDGLAQLAREVVRQDPLSGTSSSSTTARAGCSGPTTFLHTAPPSFGCEDLDGVVDFIVAARSTSRFHRLHCFIGGLCGGTSYRYAWAL